MSALPFNMPLLAVRELGHVLQALHQQEQLLGFVQPWREQVEKLRSMRVTRTNLAAWSRETLPVLSPLMRIGFDLLRDGDAKVLEVLGRDLEQQRVELIDFLKPVGADVVVDYSFCVMALAFQRVLVLVQANRATFNDGELEAAIGELHRLDGGAPDLAVVRISALLTALLENARSGDIATAHDGALARAAFVEALTLQEQLAVLQYGIDPFPFMRTSRTQVARAALARLMENTSTEASRAFFTAAWADADVAP